MRRKKNSWEIYSGIRVRSPIVIRADGRRFKKLLLDREKPYDADFARSVADAAIKFYYESGLIPKLAFIFSDEINLLFLDAPFGGRLEKLNSVVAGFLSGALSISLNRVVSMDSRVIPLCGEEIINYFSERQDEAWRNHVFSYGFYTLVSEGNTHAQTMEMLRGLKEREIHEMLFQRGTNLAKTPTWQRRGVMVYRLGGKLVQNWDLPLFTSEDGEQLLKEIIRGNED
jgi:tRNA(His) guanylyltransferase